MSKIKILKKYPCIREYLCYHDDSNKFFDDQYGVILYPKMNNNQFNLENFLKSTEFDSQDFLQKIVNSLPKVKLIEFLSLAQKKKIALDLLVSHQKKTNDILYVQDVDEDMVIDPCKKFIFVKKDEMLKLRAELKKKNEEFEELKREYDKILSFYKKDNHDLKIELDQLNNNNKLSIKTNLKRKITFPPTETESPTKKSTNDFQDFYKINNQPNYCQTDVDRYNNNISSQSNQKDNYNVDYGLLTELNNIVSDKNYEDIQNYKSELDEEICKFFNTNNLSQQLINTKKNDETLSQLSNNQKIFLPTQEIIEENTQSKKKIDNLSNSIYQPSLFSQNINQQNLQFNVTCDNFEDVEKKKSIFLFQVQDLDKHFEFEIKKRIISIDFPNITYNYSTLIKSFKTLISKKNFSSLNRYNVKNLNNSWFEKNKNKGVKKESFHCKTSLDNIHLFYFHENTKDIDKKGFSLTLEIKNNYKKEENSIFIDILLNIIKDISYIDKVQFHYLNEFIVILPFSIEENEKLCEEFTLNSEKSLYEKNDEFGTIRLIVGDYSKLSCSYTKNIFESLNTVKDLIHKIIG